MSELLVNGRFFLWRSRYSKLIALSLSSNMKNSLVLPMLSNHFYISGSKVTSDMLTTEKAKREIRELILKVSGCARSQYDLLIRSNRCDVMKSITPDKPLHYANKVLLDEFKIDLEAESGST